MKRTIYSSTFLLLFLGVFALQQSSGQTTIVEQDFDTATTWNYESDIPFFNCSGGSDFLGIRDVSATGLDFASLTTNILSEQDLDSDCGTSGEAVISFPSLTTSTDISTYTGVSVSFDYDVEGYNANADEAHYELFYDGVGQGRVVLQTGSTSGDDSEGSVDVNIPDSVNNLRLEIIVENNGGSGEAGFDNFQLTGVPATTDTQVNFANSSTTVNEGDGTVNVDLSILNEDANNATSVDVVLTSGDAADIDNYTTQTVSFPAGSASNETLTINLTDDMMDEPDETLTFELQNASGGNNAQIGASNTFDLTLEDNDLSPPITLPYSEDFSNCSTAEWITFDEAGTTNSWTCGNGEYQMNGFDGSGDDIDWLVSDFRVNFDDYSSVNIDVTTQERFGDDTNQPGEFRLAYSTDYDGLGDPTTGTWNDLTFEPQNTSTGFTLSPVSTVSVDASSVSGTAFIAFIYDQAQGTGAEDWRVQQVDISGVPATSNDSDSDIVATAFDPDDNIDYTNYVSTYLEIAEFDIRDGGASNDTDNQSTTLTGLDIDIQGHENIQSIALYDGNTQLEEITNVSASVSFSGLNLVAADDAVKTFSVQVQFMTTVTDNEQIQVSIASATADTNGSLFATTDAGGASSSVTGDDNRIEVTASQLAFSQQPTEVVVNETMAPAVEVSALDANDNLDLDFTDAVEITSTGTLNNDPVSANAVSGVASFNNLVHTAIATGLELTASTTSLNVTSNLFDVTDVPDVPSLIITEVADPGDEFEGRFVEIYNNGDETIDLSAEQIYFARQANGGNFASTALTGTLAPDRILVIGNSSNINTTYGFSADVDFGSVTGNGDDGYFIYFGGDETSGTLLDAYGVIDEDGSGNPWEYENSRAIRNNPKTDLPTSTWTASQWTITAADIPDMTPGALENEFRYKNAWRPEDASGTSTASDEIKIIEGTAVISAATTALNTEVAAVTTLDLDADLTSDITFKSDANGSAQLADATGATINGDVTVERFIPVATEDTRAFRFLSSAVDSNSPIFDNWQESGNSPAGFGTHITGAQGTVGNISSGGFDETLTGNPSMYTFDNTFIGNQDDAWNEIPNTNNTDLEAGKAYRIFIRGDRNYDLSSADPVDGPNSDVTLRAKGSLLTGSQTFTFNNNSDDYSLVGNPYQAIVDMNTVMSNTTNINTNYYWVWDPNISSRGGYVAVQLSSGDTFEPGTSGGTAITSDANEYVMPGQSFFVQTTSGSAANLEFTEASKDVSPLPTSVFSDNNLSSLNLKLFKTEDLNNNELESDALQIDFNDQFANAVTIEDADKLGNPDENLARMNNGEYLTIEKRAMPINGETLAIFTDGYTATDYTFVSTISNMPQDVSAYLIDDHTGDQTLLNEGQDQISFTVDPSSPGSVATDRFSIEFEIETFGVEDNEAADNFKVYPNPVENDQITIQAPNMSGEVDISLSNMLGQRVMSTKGELSGNGEMTLNIGDQQSGVYFIEVGQDGQTAKERLIIK